MMKPDDSMNVETESYLDLENQIKDAVLGERSAEQEA